MRVTGDQAITVEWCMIILPFILVAVRIYARYYRLRTATKSDGVVVFTFFCFLVGNILDTICWKKGLYRENLTYVADWLAVVEDRDDVILIDKLQYAAVIVYFMSLWGVKASVLLIYWPLIPKSLKLYRRVLHCIAAFTGIAFAVAVCVNMFWCIPISRNWHPEVGPESCHSFTSPYTYGTAAILHIICDAMIYILPFQLLRVIHISRRKLVSIGSIFGLGFLVVIAGIVRVVAIGTTVNIPQVGVWSSVEQAVGVTVVCVPALRTAIIHRREMLGHRRNAREDPEQRLPEVELGSTSKAGRAWRWLRGRSRKATAHCCSTCSGCQTCSLPAESLSSKAKKGKETMSSTCATKLCNSGLEHTQADAQADTDGAIATGENIMMYERRPCRPNTGETGRDRTWARGPHDDDHLTEKEPEKDDVPADLGLSSHRSLGPGDQENLTSKWESGEPIVVKIPPLAIFQNNT